MVKRFKYIQILLESLIPLLGFYFWNWSLYFILLFYFLDLVADEVITHLKSKAISKEQKHGLSRKIAWPALSLLMLTLMVFLIHVNMIQLVPGIDFAEEAYLFWTYTELGVQQGYVLLPLVFVAAFQKYKMEFLRPRKYRWITHNDLWRQHILATLLLIGIVCFVLGLSVFLVFREQVYVLGIVAGVAVFKLLR